jgi:hypothetical protein
MRERGASYAGTAKALESRLKGLRNDSNLQLKEATSTFARYEDEYP